MTVQEAAKILGLTPQTVRFGLQQERLPFGCAVKTTNSRWTYHISEHLLKAYIGEEAYDKAIKELDGE